MRFFCLLMFIKINFFKNQKKDKQVHLFSILHKNEWKINFDFLNFNEVHFMSGQLLFLVSQEHGDSQCCML